MDLYSQLRTLNQEDTRIKEDEFDKLNDIMAEDDSMINNMYELNTLNFAVRKLTYIIREDTE